MNSNREHTSLEPGLWSTRYREYLTIMARRKMPEDQVEDLVQETFLAALKSAPKFKGESTERVWLTAILNNKIVDFYRRAHTRQGSVWHTAVRDADFPLWKSERIGAETQTADSVTADLYARELSGILASGFTKLGRRERQVMQLKIDGYCTEAICNTLEINESNSLVALSRARKKLKNFLAANWHDVA